MVGYSNDTMVGVRVFSSGGRRSQKKSDTPNIEARFYRRQSSTTFRASTYWPTLEGTMYRRSLKDPYMKTTTRYV